MASYQVHAEYTIVDVAGNQARVSIPIHVSDAETIALLVTTLNAFGTPLAAATNGKVIQTSLSVLVDKAQYIVGTAPPTDASFFSVTDGARLQFSNNQGERAHFTVPAPKEVLFGADSTVVDSTQALVAALITAYEANASGPSGVAFNLYKGGSKVGRGTRLRQTRLIP